MNYCTCLLLSPVSLGLPQVSSLRYWGLLWQEGSPWHRASGAGAAGSRAAAALLVAFSAQLVGSLAQGRDSMEEGYPALPPSFPPQG